MRKPISFILAVLMIFSMALPASAVETYQNNQNMIPNISLDKNNYKSGEEICINVNVENNSELIKGAILELNSNSLFAMELEEDLIDRIDPKKIKTRSYNAIAGREDVSNFFQPIVDLFKVIWFKVESLFCNDTDCSVFIVDNRLAVIKIKTTATLPTEYSVDFDLNYESAQNNIPPQLVIAEDMAKKPLDPQRDGYTFVGWYSDKSTTSLYDFNELVIGDITLFAKWTKNIVFFDVTFEYGNGTEAITTSVAEATTVEEPEDPIKEGYLFDGWYATEETETFDFSTPIVSDITLHARWIEDTFNDTKFLVTFVLNNHISDGAYNTQIVSPNKKIVKPDDPENSQYVFTGWYTEPECINLFDFSTRIRTDLVLYAGWENPANADGIYSESEGGGTIYSITDIVVENNKVDVVLNVNQMSALVVRFLDETTEELLYTVAEQTPEYAELTIVSMPINYELPEYFIVTASLYDENGVLRCDTYRSINYTSNYEEFESLTIYDFDDQTVLNFDESIDNNFAVLNEDVIEIEQNSDNNILTTVTSETEIAPVYYTFSKCDDQLDSISVGDVVLANDSNNQYQLFKVGVIEQSNNTLIIYPSEVNDITEFYDVIKVDMTAEEDGTTSTTQPEIAVNSESITTNGIEIIDVSTDALKADFDPLSINWKIKDWLTLSGSAGVSCALKIEILYDVRIFGKNYFKCKLESVTDVHLTASLTASVDNEEAADKKMTEKVNKEYKIPGIRIPTPITGLSVVVKTGVPIELSAEGSANFSFTAETTSGFEYSTDSGRHDYDKKERTIDVDAKGKAEVKIGPKVEVGVAFLGTAVEATVEAQAGAKVIAKAELQVINATNAESKHACGLCISITARWFVEAGVKLEIHIVKDILDAEIFNLTVLELEGMILFNNFDSAYISLIHSADSFFGSTAPKLGFGECPNKSYRTTIKLVDENDSVVTGEHITISRNSGHQYTSSGNSTFTEYLYNGEYNAKSFVDGHSVSKNFVVSNSAQVVELKKVELDGSIIGKVISAEDGTVISDANIIVTQGDFVVSTTKTNENGGFEAKLPSGTYCVKITKDGYITFTQYVTITSSAAVYLESSMMICGNNSKRGGFSGTIYNAISGDPVEGVKITIREGWDNPGVGVVVATLTTDANGNFIYNLKKIFSVNFGLPSGNYTAIAEKDGFSTTYFNIVVLPGEVKGGQNAEISPNMQGNYRVVLSWGANPSDLDSHMTAYTDSGYYEHIYYSDKYGVTANLDIDDTSSYGPETITITDFDNLKDGFTYAVHDYSNKERSNSRALSSSGAKVQVYNGNTLLKTYYVPTDKTGTVWRVFSINEDGEIQDINYFYNQSSPASVK